MEFLHLTERQDILDLIHWHNTNSEYVIIDTETTGKDPHTCTLIDIQMTGRHPDQAVLFDQEHAALLGALKCKIIFHNFRYDMVVLERHCTGLKHLIPQIQDTLLLSHLADENRPSHSLDSWVQDLFQDTYKEDFWNQYDNYQDAPMAARINYACADIVYTGRLYRHLQGLISGDGLPSSLVEHVHSLAFSLFNTELEGLAVDVDYLVTRGVEIKAHLERLLPQMRAAAPFAIECVELEAWETELGKRKTEKGKAGVERPQFSFGSSKQLINLFYNQLGLPPQKNEKTRSLSVDDASLDKIKELHPLVPLLQEYRGHHKVYGSYIEGTLERLKNGRIYPSFNVNGTVTGRISSSNPNMQQLPRDGGIRGIYIPDPGMVFISADYSQLEVCVEAHYTRDKNLLKILTEGVSKHDITAIELGLDRNLAKTLNFALQYWCSHFKVAKLLGVSEQEGLKVYNKYWEIYSGCKRLKEECDRRVVRGEPIRNIMGRMRRFEAGPRRVWDSAFRQAYNFLIQGTGAEITNRAFYLVDQALRSKGWGRGLFVVHDEVMITARPEYAEEAEKLLVDTMVQVASELGLTVPLKAVGSGPCERWLD